MMMASPASTTVASAPLRRSIVPSFRRTQFSPIWPLSPPAMPNGGIRRGPDRMVYFIFFRNPLVGRDALPAVPCPFPPPPLWVVEFFQPPRLRAFLVFVFWGRGVFLFVRA